MVAETKALHHLLPHLIPPVDRTYTVRFFHENTLMPRGDEVEGFDIQPDADRGSHTTRLVWDIFERSPFL